MDIAKIGEEINSGGLSPEAIDWQHRRTIENDRRKAELESQYSAQLDSQIQKEYDRADYDRETLSLSRSAVSLAKWSLGLAVLALIVSIVAIFYPIIAVFLG